VWKLKTSGEPPPDCGVRQLSRWIVVHFLFFSIAQALHTSELTAANRGHRTSGNYATTDVAVALRPRTAAPTPAPVAASRGHRRRTRIWSAPPPRALRQRVAGGRTHVPKAMVSLSSRLPGRPAAERPDRRSRAKDLCNQWVVPPWSFSASLPFVRLLTGAVSPIQGYGNQTSMPLSSARPLFVNL
jgi:hypothetical protein